MRTIARQRRGSLLIRGLIVLLCLAVLWLIGMLWFAASLPDKVAKPNRKTDAIVAHCHYLRQNPHRLS